MQIQVGNKLQITEEFRQLMRQSQPQENVDSGWPLGETVIVVSINADYVNGGIEIQRPYRDTFVSTSIGWHEYDVAQRMLITEINHPQE